MRIQQPVIEATFLKRYKRFFADVELADGSTLTAHCPNTGSLLGCLVEGAPVLLRDSESETRKLRYTFQAIRIGRTWVNVDTSLPNAAVTHAVTGGEVPELAGYDSVRREVKYGTNSRIDLLLESDGRAPCYVEVKSTTLSENGAALFPDAVTERGRKHLEELIRVVRQGARAVQFFFISRDDVEVFRPADHIDRDYGLALRRAARQGVELVAYTSKTTKRSIDIARRLEIELPPPPPPVSKKRRSAKKVTKKA